MAIPEDELVTVVIPVRNESANIETSVRSVLDQTYRNLQVVVVDGDSDDDTQAIVKRMIGEDGRLELLVNPDRIVPTALNIALDAARGRWMVRNDGHSTLRPDYVETAVALLRSGPWGGVGGRKNAVARTAAGEAVAAALNSPFGVGNSLYHFSDVEQTVDHIPFGAYPVSVLRELGGWDEQMVTNQDYELDYRLRAAGYELLFDPDLQIDWFCPQSIKGFYRQYRRYGRGKVNTLIRHPESGAIRHYMAPALVAGMAVGAGLLPFRRTRRLGRSPFVAYGGFLGLATLSVARRERDPRVLVLVPPAFAAMHIGWGLGFWEEARTFVRRSGTSGLGDLARRWRRGRDRLRGRG